jgi:hypothetical protein
MVVMAYFSKSALQSAKNVIYRLRKNQLFYGLKKLRKTYVVAAIVFSVDIRAIWLLHLLSLKSASGVPPFTRTLNPIFVKKFLQMVVF